jgi:DNA-binding CsgD family transcriptional regulator
VERTHGHTLETNLAEAHRRRGDWNEALRIVDGVLARGGTRWEFAHANVVLGHILIGRGESADGEAALVTAWSHFGRAGTGFVGHYYAALAEHHLWAGRPDAAVQQAQAGAALIAHTGDLRWLGELTVLHVRAVARRAHAGERRDAIAEAARRSVARYEEIGRRVSADGTIFADVFPVYLETARRELADAEGHPPEPDRWRRVATAWEEQRQPYPAAYARYRAAEAALLVGDPREQATADLVRAVRTARQLGAVPLLVEGEGLARRARIALPLDAPLERPGKQGADALQSLGLTQRERDVLDLLAEGQSDQEIADRLFISPKTASVHVSNIKAKMGVERRVEATLLASRLVQGRHESA